MVEHYLEQDDGLGVPDYACGSKIEPEHTICRWRCGWCRYEATSRHPAVLPDRFGVYSLHYWNKGQGYMQPYPTPWRVVLCHKCAEVFWATTHKLAETAHGLWKEAQSQAAAQAALDNLGKSV